MIYLVRRWLHERGIHRVCREATTIVGWQEPIKALAYERPDGSIFTPDINVIGPAPIYGRFHR